MINAHKCLGLLLCGRVEVISLGKIISLPRSLAMGSNVTEELARTRALLAETEGKLIQAQNEIETLRTEVADANRARQDIQNSLEQISVPHAAQAAAVGDQAVAQGHLPAAEARVAAGRWIFLAVVFAATATYAQLNLLSVAQLWAPLRYCLMAFLMFISWHYVYQERDKLCITALNLWAVLVALILRVRAYRWERATS